MLDFFKYIFDCMIQIFDFAVNNIDKTPDEYRLALDGLAGSAFFTICFIITLAKVCPPEWSNAKSIVISIIPSTIVSFVYFLIKYLFLIIK